MTATFAITGFFVGGGLGFKFSRNLKFSVFLALVFAAAVLLTDHCLRHSAANAIADCMNNSNPALTATHPLTGHRAALCELAPGKFGIYIWNADGTTANAFGRETLKHWINYFRNQGYTQLDTIRPDLFDTVAKLLAGQ